MVAFLQDDNGDLALVKNQMHLTDGKTELKQRLRSRLRVFQGEWFLDVGAGTPYYQEILGKHKNTRQVEASIKSIVSNTDGVIDLLEFSFNVDKATRTARVDFKVSCLTGNLEMSEVL